MKFLITILTILAFTSCKTVKPSLPAVTQQVKDSIVFKTDTVYHTQTIQLPGDTLEIAFAIPCPEAKNIDLGKKKGRTQLNIKSDAQGNFIIDCKTDSLTHVIDSLKTVINQKESYHNETKTITVTKVETVTEYKTPKWVWWLLAFNIGQLIWKFRNPIGGFFKKLLNKFF
ncbi:MAG: hypothetical protein IPP48_03370 [Chitinophagaceae bacterium]|nr:hypothetical protein [Chitinophagaceae bacterium]